MVIFFCNYNVWTCLQLIQFVSGSCCKDASCCTVVVVEVVESSELADVVAVSVEFDDVDVAVAVVVVVVVVAVLSVEADAVAVVVLSALDVVEVVEVVVVVVDDPDEDSDAHTSEKPFTSSYTFSTRPLVGTVRSQSGGSSAATAEISDWQSDEAHMSTYSASVGSDVE
ncbi:hypothetical protein BBJ28_00016260 [Nothophytophthora sp. Chile5]|nr:hypothetical protein BBJ28_00016260 [Nothophytophthora sp. Chile5]